MNLTNQEAKLVIISLKARCSRLRNKRREVSCSARPAIDADIRRTEDLHDRMIAHYPQALARPDAYQQALVDHAQMLSEYILDPNS